MSLNHFLLVIKYILFASIAIVVNLLAQRVVFSFGEQSPMLIFAIALGTALGLITKFFLDKKWIFNHRSTNLLESGERFTLYASFGILTTSIFWITEIIFWLIWETALMRDVGAIFGLSIGYFIKYKLDKAFVFTRTEDKENR